jgi:hypothetical protein
MPRQSEIIQTERIPVQISTFTPNIASSTRRRGKIVRLPRDIRDRSNQSSLVKASQTTFKKPASRVKSTKPSVIENVKFGQDSQTVS